MSKPIEKSYDIKFEGRLFGPFSLEQCQQLLKDGGLVPRTVQGADGKDVPYQLYYVNAANKFYYVHPGNKDHVVAEIVECADPHAGVQELLDALRVVAA